MLERRRRSTDLHREKTIKERVKLRAQGSKIQLVTLIATVGGLLALPEFAQAIGAGGALAIAISNFLKARQD